MIKKGGAGVLAPPFDEETNMNAKAKKALKVTGVVLGVIVVLVAVLLWRIGSIIEGSVNTVVPKLLGVPVSVSDVDVSVLRGEVKISNFEIGNPEGFDTPYMFHLGTLHVDVATRDLFKGTCHIREIHVGEPKVWYHQKLTSNNIAAFLGQLEERFPPPEKEDKTDKPKNEKKSMPVVIDHFLVDEGTIGVKVGAGFEVPLLEIELNDIGKDGAFMPIQIVQILVKSILSSVVHAVGSVGGAAVDAVGAVGGAAADAVGAVGGAAVKGVGAAVKGIGSLFGGGDKTAETNAAPESVSE